MKPRGHRRNALRTAIEAAEAEIAHLDRRRALLEKQVEDLREALRAEDDSEGRTVVATPAPAGRLDAREKVALFRSLFRGREDVFPKLWVSPKTGKKGYSPTCRNDWVRGVCEKPRVRCGDCPSQALLPTSDQVILDHLQGRHVIGCYPLLAARLAAACTHVVVLRGGTGAKLRRETLARLRAIPPDEPRLLLATGRYVGEGFDDARLDTLFLAMPISWRGTLVQYAGRLHRPLPGKTEARIVDYVDRQVPVLGRMFERRMRGYREIGIASPPRRAPRRSTHRLTADPPPPRRS